MFKSKRTLFIGLLIILLMGSIGGIATPKPVSADPQPLCDYGTSHMEYAKRLEIYGDDHLHWPYNLTSATDEPIWTASTVQYSGDIVRPLIPNGYYYECTVAGTTDTTEPTWPTTPNATVTDNTVTWTCRTDDDVDHAATAWYHANFALYATAQYARHDGVGCGIDDEPVGYLRGLRSY